MTNLPAILPHEALDLALRQAAQRLTVGCLDFVALAQQAIADKVWERFGFVDEQPYWEDRIGVGYRTLRRWLSIAGAIGRLPAGEQPEARQALVALGTHKAAALAKVVGTEHDWRELAEFAQEATTAAVQQRVSEVTGALPRGVASPPGARFLAFILANVPPATKDHVAATFEATMKHAELTHPIAAFLLMIDRMAADLADQGVEVW